MSDTHEPGPEESDPHWAMDMPEGQTVEDLADSMIREADAINQLQQATVYVGRGDAEPLAVTPEMRRERRQR